MSATPLMEQVAEKSPRWWTPMRVVLAVIWLTMTTVGAVALLLFAGFFASTLLGTEPSADSLRAAAMFAVPAAFVGAAGPFGVWIARRSRPWLVATALPLVICLGYSTWWLVASFSAPTPGGAPLPP